MISKGLCEDVEEKGHFGTGNAEFKIAALDEIEDAMFLIKQAYNKRAEEEE